MPDRLRTGTDPASVPVRRDHRLAAPSGAPEGPDPRRHADRQGLRARIPDLIVAMIVLVLTGAAVSLAVLRPPVAVSVAEPVLSAAPAGGPPTSVPATKARPVVADGDPEAPPPRRVRIDRIGVDTALIDLRVQADGELEVPADFGVAGWHRAGTAPGDRGPAVLVGHVDSFEGPAVFYRLRELTPGDRVTVARTDGSAVAFEVYGVERYAKESFPTDAVYGATEAPELRLVTCGGAFDEQSRSYRDNVVVYAREAPLGPRP